MRKSRIRENIRRDREYMRREKVEKKRRIRGERK
jgi:hypothetical protein